MYTYLYYSITSYTRTTEYIHAPQGLGVLTSEFSNMHSLSANQNGPRNLQNVIHGSSDGRVDKTRSGRRLCRQCCGIKTAAASANAAAPYPKANTPVRQ